MGGDLLGVDLTGVVILRSGDLTEWILREWCSYGSGSYGSGVLTEWIGPVADGMRIDRIPVGLDPKEDPATS